MRKIYPNHTSEEYTQSSLTLPVNLVVLGMDKLPVGGGESLYVARFLEQERLLIWQIIFKTNPGRMVPTVGFLSSNSDFTLGNSNKTLSVRKSP